MVEIVRGKKWSIGSDSLTNPYVVKNGRIAYKGDLREK